MLEDEYEMPPDPIQGSATENNAAPEQTSKYTAQGEQIDVSVMGDNFGSVINHNGLTLADVIQLFKELSSLGLNQNDTNASFTFASSSSVQGNARKRQLADIVGQELQDVAMDSEATTDYQSGTNDPAAMPAEIDEWYYDQLDDYERAYVIAVAVLQGATANDITRKAREIYQYAIIGGQAGGQTGVASTTVGIFPVRSASRLRKNTYTTLQEGGDPRVFWKNSEFGRRMLRFIAEEAVEWPGSQPGQNFIAMLQGWVEELSGESSRRAARMLGSILAYQSTNQLWRIANTWANRKSARDWRMAASLLNGAYEVGLSSQNGRSASTLTNSVLQLLAQWSERWLQAGNFQVGCAAAHTFALIGRRSPTLALQGLDRLLQPSQRGTDTKNSSASGNKNALPGQLVSAIVQGYVALAFAGHIRIVLSNLAAHAELLVHQYQQPAKVSQYLYYKRQREGVLDLTFDAFFLIAASSLSAASPMPARGYSADEVLPAEPPLPDRNGRDILLAGLFATSEIAWRNDLTTLLCAAIIEGKSKPAFDLLQQWAGIVLSQPQDKMGALYTQFVTFMVHLGKTLHLWSSELTNKGLNRSSAVQTYQSRLIAWQQEGARQPNGINTLAQHVLQLIS